LRMVSWELRSGRMRTQGVPRSPSSRAGAPPSAGANSRCSRRRCREGLGWPGRHSAWVSLASRLVSVGLVAGPRYSVPALVTRTSRRPLRAAGRAWRAGSARCTVRASGRSRCSPPPCRRSAGAVGSAQARRWGTRTARWCSLHGSDEQPRAEMDHRVGGTPLHTRLDPAFEGHRHAVATWPGLLLALTPLVGRRRFRAAPGFPSGPFFRLV
jgi:hypothetical protein